MSEDKMTSRKVEKSLTTPKGTTKGGKTANGEPQEPIADAPARASSAGSAACPACGCQDLLPAAGSAPRGLRKMACRNCGQRVTVQAPEAASAPARKVPTRAAFECPGCGHTEADVEQTRPTSGRIVRIRVCRKCKRRFSTVERASGRV